MFITSTCQTYVVLVHQYFNKVKVGVLRPFNSQCDVGTGPPHHHLWEMNPHRGDSLWLDAKPLGH